MSNSNQKQYRIVDHANKFGDRESANPNRCRNDLRRRPPRRGTAQEETDQAGNKQQD